MTDLVKRLQYQAGCKDPDLHKADVDLLWEAADRIAELEAELAYAKRIASDRYDVIGKMEAEEALPV